MMEDRVGLHGDQYLKNREHVVQPDTSMLRERALNLQQDFSSAMDDASNPLGIKLIAMDLDGTALVDDSHMSEAVQKAIADAARAGVQCVIASGRPRSSIPNELLSLPGIRYAITSNGAEIYKTSAPSGVFVMQRIHAVTMKPSMEEAILQVTEPYYRTGRLMYETFINGEAYAAKQYIEDPVAYGINPLYRHYVQSTRFTVEDMPSFIRSHQKDILGLDMVVGDRVLHDQMHEILEPISAKEHFYLTWSVRNRLECGNGDAGKDHALCWMMQYLGCNVDQTASFGDAGNDIPMIKAAGYGIAVANASPDCLAAADYRTASNLEDGVAKGIYEILKIRSDANHF